MLAAVLLLLGFAVIVAVFVPLIQCDHCGSHHIMDRMILELIGGRRPLTPGERAQWSALGEEEFRCPHCDNRNRATLLKAVGYWRCSYR